MLLDVSPLRRHRDFRLLFIGQFVSAMGSFLTYVALPVQIYQAAHSSAIVGLLSLAQLVPLAATALWGGALADAVDRRRLLLVCESLLLLGALAIFWQASRAEPSMPVLFVAAAFMSALSGLHTPALESLTPRLVDIDDLSAVSALASLRGTVAAVAGPALAGVAIAAFGLPFTFALDAGTYLLSLCALFAMHALPPLAGAARAGLVSVLEGLAYARSRPELIGTYAVDIVAMTFAMPMAVFPALAARWGGTQAVGYLYSAMSVGALLVTVFSGWTAKVERRGAAVVIAAALWGLAIFALGHAPNLAVAVICLVAAGAADMVSGLFRMTIWNETIPSHFRGRLAGVEQISYMTGPLLGNVRAGFAAERFGVERAIAWGGLACMAAVGACAAALPAFWRYRRSRVTVASDPA